MFDDYARSMFVDLSEFEGLVRDDATRAMSQAYLAIISHRVNGLENAEKILDEVQPYLRRLANTLIFHLVLDSERDTPERQAAAFVAAEAISLVADYLAITLEDVENAELGNRTRSAERFARAEAALLYLYAAYDACAAGVLREQLRDEESGDLVDSAADWCFTRLDALCSLSLSPPLNDDFGLDFRASDDLTPGSLERDTVARLYVDLGIAVTDFISWLTGNLNGLESAVRRTTRLLNALSVTESEPGAVPTGYEYSRIFHLGTLLQLCFPALGERSLVHRVPTPTSGDPIAYRTYLIARAVGHKRQRSRPVLWPSALEYVRSCLLGDAQHCVAAMPTGSGKSFVGELAVSQAVQSGWVLYLAPTNALTEQIRGDLKEGLRALKTEILAFIGDQEYSIFTAERVNQMPTNSVAVMTPEKCALALRLSPAAFDNCQLVVFDECHLLGDTGSTRGPVAELVLTQLMLRAPGCRFLLMSAIVQNPEDLSGWLGEATGGKSEPVTVRWRPTRTLRAVLGVDQESVDSRGSAAIETLKTCAERTKKRSFNSECSLAVCLQGAWQSEDEVDYSVSKINCEAPLKAVRRKVRGVWRYHWEGDSWVNKCAISLATALAESGIQTLVFTPANKHYPFSNAKKATLAAATLESLADKSPFVDVCRTLADYELGVGSQVFYLLDKGIAVHTSLMLETEKIGAELCFRSRSAPLMFATGTLAQGLNLPAIAVIIAGSRIGDPRGEDQEEVQRRKFSQLLNAAGRAGRAGFANQGLVVAVPDEPVAFADHDSVMNARRQVDYLQKSDDAVRVGSGLTDFLDSLCADTLRSDQASDKELQVISLIAGGDEHQIDPKPVLRSTYAAYLRRQAGQPEVADEDADRLIAIGADFVASTGAPEWLTIAAQRAGLDFFLTLAISQAWERVRGDSPTETLDQNVRAWLNEFLSLIVHIPPGLLAKQLPPSKLKHVSEQFKTLIADNASLFYERELDWSPISVWEEAWQSAVAPLDAWMGGRSYAEIASILTGKPTVEIPSDRQAGNPIPKALSVSQDAWSSLALIAGGFLAVAEQVLEGEVPLTLASLPMCIKYGCDSPGTLAWYRFGVRLRRPARLLATRYPPPELASDDELKEWVRQARRDWLNSDVSDEPVFEATRAFITNKQLS